MLSKLLSSSLAKAQICEFLGLSQRTKESKAQLITELQQLIENDVDQKQRLLDTFPKELAVGPSELESLLQCSKIERKRWVSEGKIPIMESRSFRKFGRNLLCPIYDRRVIMDLSQEEIAQWRETYRSQVQEHRRRGAYSAAEQRKANQQIRQRFHISWQHTVEEWKQQGSLELAVVFQLAYWAVWASRWAKENHLRYLRGTKHSTLYASRRDAWYQHKNEIMRLLVRTPYTQMFFYRPINADKRSLWLCETHDEMKREEYYKDIWDFFYENTYVIRTCPQCIIDEKKDFYALYYIEVAAAAFPDVQFAFHIPYPLGKQWFPSANKLPHVEHVEQDGLFRFGRTILNTEKILYREKDVLMYLEQALTDMRNLSNPNLKEECVGISSNN